MRFSRAVSLGVLLALSCGQPSERSPSHGVQRSERTVAPTTREGFLAAIAPLPFDALVVVYDVHGPGGLHGTLEVLARPGGYRRHNWRLHLPIGHEDPVEIEGSAVLGPDAQWTEDGDVVQDLVPRPLGALAEAYVAASPELRRAVMEAVQGWRAELARGRETHPGSTQSVLGIECLHTRVAAHDVCIWEETGLALRYEGAGFTMEARHIDTEPELGARAFSPPVDVPSGQVDGAGALRSLAAGDVTILALASCEPACSVEGLFR